MPIGALIIGDEILSGKRQDKHLPHVIATLAAEKSACGYEKLQRGYSVACGT